MNHLTVTQFVELINESFEPFQGLVVEGEVAEFKIVHSKWVTFLLKDNESAVSCFMTVWQLKVQIEDGMLVHVVGSPRLRQKGYFSFTLSSVLPAGEGSIRRAFELLKLKLEREGLFALERKRTLPRFPRHIALITSRDAAAYSDFLKVLRDRFGGLSISFIHSQVQGEHAPDQILEAINMANTQLASLDVIVLVRGGGSLEDLQSFNDEQVVRAIATSRTPTLVGIGHERDSTLAELAADVRASTPSNAAELVVPSRSEVTGEIASYTYQLSTLLHKEIVGRMSQTSNMVHAIRFHVVRTSARVQETITRLHSIHDLLKQQTLHLTLAIAQCVSRVMTRWSNRHHTMKTNLETCERMLKSLSPNHILRRGYSITRLGDGTLVRAPSEVHLESLLVTTLHAGTIHSTVTHRG